MCYLLLVRIVLSTVSMLSYTGICFTVFKWREEFEDTKGVNIIRISKTTQWPKEKVAKDEQRYTKHTYKTKDLVTRSPLKT